MSSEVARRVQGAAALSRRLAVTFSKNPWTLVALLSGLASACSVVEQLRTLVGDRLLVGVSVAVAAFYLCPITHRGSAIVALAVGLAFLLASGLVQ